MKFRKKPIEIEAVQVSWKTWPELSDFLAQRGHDFDAHPGREIDAEEASDTLGEVGPIFIAIDLVTTHGDIAVARHGDWVVPESVHGRFYPVKPDVFAATYEPVLVTRLNM